MKILLVNSNRYKYPPVIPVGLEYIAGEIQKSLHSFTKLQKMLESGGQSFDNRVEFSERGLKEDDDVVFDDEPDW